MKIGCHVGMFAPNYLLDSVKEALSYGANTFMFYTGAPQNSLRTPVEKLKIDELKKMLDNADYVDLTSCSYFTEYIYCEALFDSIGANKVIFTKEDLSSLKNNLPSNFSEKLKQFINYINYGNNNNYRLIVEFSDETYASLLVK